MQAAQLLDSSPSAQPSQDDLESLERERPTLTLIVGGKDALAEPTEAKTRETFRAELAVVLPSLFPRALLLCRDAEDARDLVADTAERALRFSFHFSPGSNLRAWLGQILFSVFVTRCRRLGRQRRAHDWMRDDPCAWPKQDLAPVMQDFSPRLRAAIEELPSAFAETLMLVDVAELSYRDAALELGVPVGTVMSRLHRARRLLRESLQLPPVAAAG